MHIIVVITILLGLITPAFVTCSNNVEEGLIKLSHIR